MSAPREHASTLGAIAGLVMLALPLVLALLLGALWARDRSQRYETPHWDAARFELLLQSPLPPDRRETWVMAVHPECPHCMTRVPQMADSARAAGVRSVALVVDSATRPGEPVLARLPMDEVRWDRRGVWRRRWGHRAYGECMRFDRDGRLLVAGAAER